MDATRELVFKMLQGIPKGTLLFVDYVPAGKPDAAASAAAEASRAAGIDPHHYIGTFQYAEVKGGEPLFYMRVHNRHQQIRCFAPFKGTLRDIKALKPAPTRQAA